MAGLHGVPAANLQCDLGPGSLSAFAFPLVSEAVSVDYHEEPAQL